MILASTTSSNFQVSYLFISLSFLFLLSFFSWSSNWPQVSKTNRKTSKNWDEWPMRELREKKKKKEEREREREKWRRDERPYSTGEDLPRKTIYLETLFTSKHYFSRKKLLKNESHKNESHHKKKIWTWIPIGLTFDLVIHFHSQSMKFVPLSISLSLSLCASSFFLFLSVSFSLSFQFLSLFQFLFLWSFFSFFQFSLIFSLYFSLSLRIRNPEVTIVSIEPYSILLPHHSLSLLKKIMFRFFSLLSS